MRELLKKYSENNWHVLFDLLKCNREEAIEKLRKFRIPDYTYNIYLKYFKQYFPEEVEKYDFLIDVYKEYENRYNRPVEAKSLDLECYEKVVTDFVNSGLSLEEYCSKNIDANLTQVKNAFKKVMCHNLELSEKYEQALAIDKSEFINYIKFIVSQINDNKDFDEYDYCYLTALDDTDFIRIIVDNLENRDEIIAAKKFVNKVGVYLKRHVIKEQEINGTTVISGVTINKEDKQLIFDTLDKHNMPHQIYKVALRKFVNGEKITDVIDENKFINTFINTRDEYLDLLMEIMTNKTGLSFEQLMIIINKKLTELDEQSRLECLRKISIVKESHELTDEECKSIVEQLFDNCRKKTAFINIIKKIMSNNYNDQDQEAIINDLVSKLASGEELQKFVEAFKENYPDNNEIIMRLDALNENFRDIHYQPMTADMLQGKDFALKQKTTLEKIIESGYSIEEYCSVTGDSISDTYQLLRSFKYFSRSEGKQIKDILESRSNENLYKKIREMTYELAKKEDFDMLDYYSYTKLKVTDYLKIAKEIVENQEIYNKVSVRLRTENKKQRRLIIAENEINSNIIIGGRQITKEEKEKIFEYLKQNNLPNSMFTIVLRKYVKGELDLSKQLTKGNL